MTYQAGDLKRHRFKVGGGSYLSSHDPREVLGIGKRTKIDKLEIRWPQPSGRVETFTDLPLDPAPHLHQPPLHASGGARPRFDVFGRQ